MDGLSPESARVEEARIRMAYAKRQGNDARYSWFSPGHLFIMQERERRLLTLLQRTVLRHNATVLGERCTTCKRYL